MKYCHRKNMKKKPTEFGSDHNLPDEMWMKAHYRKGI
jgi:hypothetical protein